MVRRLLYLNGIAILGVILFHAAGWGFVAMFSWAGRYQGTTAVPFSQMGSPAYYVLRTIEQLVVATIPAFLFVSGYFVAFATGRSETIGWATVGARIKKFLMPYLFWGTISLVMLAAQDVYFTPLEYVVSFLTGSMTPAYYYIPLLIQLYAVSPLIVPLAKKHWKPLLGVAILVQVTIQASQLAVIMNWEIPEMLRQVANLPKWIFPARFLWFALGMIIGFNLTSFKAAVARWKWVLLGLSIILIPLGMLEWEWIIGRSGQPWVDHRETILDSIYSVCIIFTFLAFDKAKLLSAKLVSDLGSKAFGIYLAHIPVMEIVARGIYHVAPGLLAYQVIFLPLMIVFGLGIPLLMMYATNLQPIRRYYGYVFG